MIIEENRTRRVFKKIIQAIIFVIRIKKVHENV